MIIREKLKKVGESRPKELNVTKHGENLELRKSIRIRKSKERKKKERE